MRVRAGSHFSRMAVMEPVVRAGGPTVKSVRLSQLGKIRDCEQVAAVCYRLRNGDIDFLLVQTRGSQRWTFPKGSAEPGLTHAQAAAIEAFEEAGVHGRIEEEAFIRYRSSKAGPRSSARSAAKATVVSAHLCEVRRLCAPKESGRNRTWFPVEEAKRKLQEGRKKADRQEFSRVLRYALLRINRRRSLETPVLDPVPGAVMSGDEMQRVQFETRTAWRREGPDIASRSGGGQAVLGEVLPFGPSRLLPGKVKG